MVFATGDVDFGLMKFAQFYVDSDNPADYEPITNFYINNQTASGTDVLRYSSGGNCTPTFAAYDPTAPASEDYQWLCVEFPDPDPAEAVDNRGPIMMWMDHHEFDYLSDPVSAAGDLNQLEGGIAG